MAAILKATAGLDSRWTECLQRHYPFHDPELGEYLLTVLAYVTSRAPQIWTETESKGAKGCKTSPIERIHIVQKRFDRHQGELAAVVCVFRAWEKVPKRERLRWCRRNHINNGSMSQVQEVWIKLKAEVQKMGRRRSLRSAETATLGAEEEAVLSRLASLLLKVFADCGYMRWHTSQTYINLVTAAPRIVDFTDFGLFEAFNVTLPAHILYLPNVTSRGREDDFNPATEVTIGLVIPDPIAQTARKSVSALVKNTHKITPLTPERVELPAMGDAVVLRLAGNHTAQDELREAIIKVCGKDDMLLDIKVHEPHVGAGGAERSWRLEIHCQQMYHTQIEHLMCEKVRVTMEELETEVELVAFPDLDSGLRLLVGAGGHVQEVQSNQHPVLVYFIRRQQEQANIMEVDNPTSPYEELTEELISTTLGQYGKIIEVQKSRDFPQETLWGTVRFEFLSSALKAAKESDGMLVLDRFLMKVIHIESECQVYKLNFHWRRSTLVRNRLQMYFLNEEDLNKFKRQKLHNEFKREYNDDELKAIITTDDTYSNLPDHTSMISHLSVYPKFTTYNHHVIYEASEADIPNVKNQLKERMSESFTDPDLIDITFEKPKPGASIMTGTFNSYSVHRLMRLEDYIGYYEGSSLLAGGEMATDRRVHMNFTLPTEAFAKIEPELKTIHRKRVYSRGASDDSETTPEDDFYRTDTMFNNNNKNSYINVKPEGECINVTFYGDNYWARIGQELKMVPKLMKPHVVHIKGDLLAALLATTKTEKKEPNVVQIMTETDTFIQVIKRNSLVHIYGAQKNVLAAQDKIRSFLNKPSTDTQRLGTLRTPQRAGTSRQGGRGRGRGAVSRVVVTESCSSGGGETQGECSVCLCEVQGTACRLSLCGHVYCTQCLYDLVNACRNARTFPVRCVKDQCNHIVLNADIEQTCADHAMPMTHILTASMQAFQRKHMTRVYPCITPDCEMVYRMCTSKQEGMVRSFTCPLCKVNLCTFCHCAYHTGLSCTVFKAMQKVDDKVKTWMDQDRDFRKLCPNCTTGIEKVDGCDHLHCTACKAEICWVCLQFFTDARKMSYHRCSGEDADSDAESEADGPA